jgi:hypothetical protein
VTPVEKDGDIVGRHRVRETYRAALHELQGERGEPVTLLEFLAHFFLPYSQYGCVSTRQRPIGFGCTLSSIRLKHLDSLPGQAYANRTFSNTITRAVSDATAKSV